jgi:UDP-N-acetyl-D-glucosamine/UDP-N-acetyl-D-galactosamine dehydrogenase
MKISIIGLGYVGLPLAIEFSKSYETIGFDINRSRIQQLIENNDMNGDVEISSLLDSKVVFTSSIEDIVESDIYIVTTPTPIDEDNNPDLTILKKACETVGSVLKKNDIVIFESTVYPGTTEEVCVPILESHSGLNFINEKNKNSINGEGFYCGYSPERINPGDKEHYLTNIVKITSGSTEEIAQKIDNLYKSIIKAGTYRAESIMVAEAAKIIENTQRDVNIALVNELSIIFNKLGIDTKQVLRAAETKWNFNRYDPGLVGGHCIGVDPYYLAYKSIQMDYYPEMILSGRKINDGMPQVIIDRTIEMINQQGKQMDNINTLIMGLSFKKDCKDLRNSKVFNLAKILNSKKSKVDIYDPFINQDEVNEDNIFNLVEEPRNKYYDVIIIAVDHSMFASMSINQIRSYGTDDLIILDLKSIFPIHQTNFRL